MRFGPNVVEHAPFSIPMIGNTASGVLCQVFHGNLDEFRDAVYAGYDFRQLPPCATACSPRTCPRQRSLR